MSFLTVEDLKENLGVEENARTVKSPYAPILWNQGPDASAAFARVQILRKAKKNLERDLNSTNLNGLTPKMRDMYNILAIEISELIEEELKLVRDGEAFE